MVKQQPKLVSFETSAEESCPLGSTDSCASIPRGKKTSPGGTREVDIFKLYRKAVESDAPHRRKWRNDVEELRKSYERATKEPNECEPPFQGGRKDPRRLYDGFRRLRARTRTRDKDKDKGS